MSKAETEVTAKQIPGKKVQCVGWEEFPVKHVPLASPNKRIYLVFNLILYSIFKEYRHSSDVEHRPSCDVNYEFVLYFNRSPKCFCISPMANMNIQ